jgi:hypothetical protein
VAAEQRAAGAAGAQQKVAACTPLAVAAAALSMLAQLAEDAASRPAGAAATQVAGAGHASGLGGHMGPSTASSDAEAWGVLRRVFVSTAAEISQPRSQRALLRLCLEVQLRSCCILKCIKGVILRPY